VVYASQIHWVSGLYPSFGILYGLKTQASETDLFQSSGEGTEAPTLLGPSERAGPVIEVNFF
jgi:hypothetical protein